MIVEVERRESSSAGHAPHHLQGSVERSEVSLEDLYDWVDERVCCAGEAACHCLL